MKVALIGLDGVGLDALRIFSTYMPFLRSLLRSNPLFEVDTIPPYTPPIWTSIATGVNPGKHGIAGFTRVEYNGYKFIEHIASSFDVKYPRIWEYLSLLNKRSIIINFPLTYPFNAMYLNKNVILIPGWDSPKVTAYPSKITDVLPELLVMGEHEWGRFLGKNKKYVEEYLNRLMIALHKRLFALKKLLSKFNHELLAIIFSETDWLQHLVVRSSDDIERYNVIANILDMIDKFLAYTVDKYDYVFIASDHDHHTHAACYNIVYPLIRENILDIYIDTKYYSNKEISNPIIHVLNKIINAKIYRRVALSSVILRKIMISSLAKLVKGRLKYKNLFIAEENTGIYVIPSIRDKLDEIKSLYYSEFGLRLLNSEDIFWGPYLKYLPDLIVDYRSLDRSYGLINEPVLKKIFMIEGRNHYPNGLLVITGNACCAKRVKAKLVKPWDIGATIFALITNLLPDDMDGKCLPMLECHAKKFPLSKKLMLIKKVKKMKRW